MCAIAGLVCAATHPTREGRGDAGWAAVGGRTAWGLGKGGDGWVDEAGRLPRTTILALRTDAASCIQSSELSVLGNQRLPLRAPHSLGSPRYKGFLALTREAENLIGLFPSLLSWRNDSS